MHTCLYLLTATNCYFIYKQLNQFHKNVQLSKALENFITLEDLKDLETNQEAILEISTDDLFYKHKSQPEVISDFEHVYDELVNTKYCSPEYKEWLEYYDKNTKGIKTWD